MIRLFAFGGAVFLLSRAIAADAVDPQPDPIVIESPLRLDADALAAERVLLGKENDYKPCVVRLRSGDLLAVAFHQHPQPENKVREEMVFFRSEDEGRTWADGQPSDLPGREPYFSMLDDGTLFLTTHLLEQDVHNELGYTHSYLHCSRDGGESWETLRIDAGVIPDAPPQAWILTSRNILELETGTLILGVSAPGGRDFFWRSVDQGRTWDRSLASAFVGVDKAKVWWPFHAETVFFQPRNGDLLAIARVDPRAFPSLPGTMLPAETGDQVERMMVFRSTNGGAKWKFEQNLGTYGEMYPQLLRLMDGRLLLTFTVRALAPQLGLRAVVGRETASGFRFDMSHDRIVLDGRTPEGLPSGGGFGPTIQLPDETLLSVYSYRGADEKTHLEAVRWNLPEE
jgi:hypothetical protein